MSKASVLVAGVVVIAACSGTANPTSTRPTSTSLVASTAPSSEAASTTTTTVADGAHSVCGNVGKPPRRYRSVVVFAFENRTWDDVGMGFGSEMAYLHGLARTCGYFTDWAETDTHQDSLTQYVGQVTGLFEPSTVNDCAPSPTCHTTADNIFRQVRRAGLVAINYVEGAADTCSAAGNAAKHVPALYLWGADDHAHCNMQVRPLTAFDPNKLPAFAFITPTLCNDGHDCANRVVDRWARTHIQPVLDSAAYAAGQVAVFVWYDEYQPVPNLWIAPTVRGGPLRLAGAGYAATLRAWESMLGRPCLARACSAADMRAAANV